MAKKASGRDIPEAERGRQGGGEVRLHLRLSEEAAEALEDLAAKWGLTKAGTVARLLERERGEE